jgi:hypothetical protein
MTLKLTEADAQALARELVRVARPLLADPGRAARETVPAPTPQPRPEPSSHQIAAALANLSPAEFRTVLGRAMAPKLQAGDQRLAAHLRGGRQTLSDFTATWTDAP